MPTRALTALLLSDGKPGHYHQAEGVLAAVARLCPVRTERIEVRRRFIVPTRALHQLVNAGAPPALVLRLGYGLRPGALQAADLIVSAGGETLAANAAAARLLGAPNIFCGRLRRVAPERVRVIIVSLERFAATPNYLVSLPPSPLDVRRRSTGQGVQCFGRLNPPPRVGVLVGGNSGAVRYGERDWQQLTGFLREAHRSHGMRWLVTTSRRSGSAIADVLAAMAGEPGTGIARFVDFRTAGPGTLGNIFADADAILCTDDSTTMISEAVAAGLPVVAVRPETGTIEAREAEYRQWLARQGWYRALPLAGLSADPFLAALEEITPRTESLLDELAGVLRRRLPELFADGDARS